MNVFNWLSGNSSNLSKALSPYKRGMAKAKKHDHQGAIDDYTKTIGIRTLVSRFVDHAVTVSAISS